MIEKVENMQKTMEKQKFNQLRPGCLNKMEFNPPYAPKVGKYEKVPMHLHALLIYHLKAHVISITKSCQLYMQRIGH